MLFAIGVGAAIIGTWLMLRDMLEDQTAVETEIERLTEEAEGTQATLDQQLEEALGQLGGNEEGDFQTYDEWYNAQHQEWEDAGSQGEFEDYLREQQTTELGTYGENRARLEEQIRSQEEILRLAEEHANFQYDTGVTASQRLYRHEQAGAGASGFRSGTPYDTVRNNLENRQAALDEYLYQTMGEIGNARAGLRAAADIGFGNLGRMLNNVRSGYDINTGILATGLEHAGERLWEQFRENYEIGDFIGNAIQWGVGVASTASNVYTGAVETGFIVPDISGDGFSIPALNLDFGGFNADNFDWDIGDARGEFGISFR